MAKRRSQHVPKPAARKRGVTKAPADIRPKSTKAKTYTWTPELDQVLRDRYSGQRSGAGSVAVIANAMGWPFHVVKQRIKALGLIGQPATTPARARSTKTRSSTSSPEVPNSNAIQAKTSATPKTARRRHSSNKAGADEHPEHKAVCATCHASVRYRLTASGAGLIVIDQQFVDAEATFSLGPTGRPECPRGHGEMLIADESIPARDAIRQVADRTERPTQLALVGEVFNAYGAWMTVEEADDEIERLQVDYDEKAADAKAARKDLDKAVRQRTLMTRELKKRRLQQLAEERAKRARQEVRADAVCVFEQDTGNDCPICRGISVALGVHHTTASITAFTDRFSGAHKAAAIHANSLNTPEQLADISPRHVVAALQLAGLHAITEEVVTTWTDAQRVEVLTWADAGMDRTKAPEALGVPHLAGPRGEAVQSCAECGAALLRFTGGPSVSYPEGALVGQFCTGVELEAPAAAAPAPVEATESA